MPSRRRALTYNEVRERVLVTGSSLGLFRANTQLWKQADVPAKDGAEALKQLVKDGLVDQWPAVKAFKVTERGLVDVAAIETRQDTRFQWTWRSHGR